MKVESLTSLDDVDMPRYSRTGTPAPPLARPRGGFLPVCAQTTRRRRCAAAVVLVLAGTVDHGARLPASTIGLEGVQAMITGGCHCGAIRYQVEGEAIVHALCHCTDCRRHAG